MPATAVPFGPTGEIVYNRTYSREKEGGGRETWPETVSRVAAGNLALVHGKDHLQWPADVMNEFNRLRYYMSNFAVIPAGRHLWATGVPGRQHLFNCHLAGWGKSLSEHYEFSFMRLMEGGGVGSNYSTRHIGKFGAPRRQVRVHVTCDPAHPDYEELRPYLSGDYEPSTGWKYDENEPYVLNYRPGTGSPHLVDDSREGWAEALTELIDRVMSDRDQRLDAVFDVSGVRPSGSKLVAFGGTASGPAPFAAMMHETAKVLNLAGTRQEFTPMDAMGIDHAIAECVVSGGNRRSARMSIVRWDDPYIYEFINCKQDTGKHWTTNISVEVDDEFLSMIKHPDMYPNAWSIHNRVIKGMLNNGEPGYWNSSLSNEGEVGEVIGTNPCGEIPLQEWENCNLGHVNMDYFADKPVHELVEAHKLITRFLMRATFGDVNDEQQAKILARNRRIGVGHLGVQGFWAKQGVKYSDIPKYAVGQLQSLYSEVRSEARTYAFQLRIPEPVKVTTVAPTGSVAKLPGVSEGIHPVYARWFERRVRFSKRDERQFQTVVEAMAKGFEVEDDQYDASGMTAVVVYPTEDILLSQVRALGLPDEVVQSQDELLIPEMLAVQACYQENWADNAVSYTLNIPEGTCSEAVLADTLAEYLPRLKGTTVMVDASRPQAPYTRITREEYESATATAVEDSTSEECANGACPVR